MKSKSTSSRLFVISGPAQLLFLGTALYKHSRKALEENNDILILRGDNVSQKRKVITEEIANKILNWGRIIWLDNADYFKQKDKKEFLRKIIPEWINEIWLCMPYAPVELNLQTIFYSAKVIFFDDGLGSCVRPISILDHVNKPSFIKKNLVFNLSKTMTWLRDSFLMRSKGMLSLGIKKQYLLFSDFLKIKNKKSKNIDMDWVDLNTIVSQFNVKEEKPLLFSNDKTCLVIGQFFSNNDSISRELELKEYLRVCEKMIDEGYDVIWKEHPKNPNPFWNDLKSVFNNKVHNLDDYYSFYWPIEILINTINVNMCISCTSTSLITINRIFGIKIMSFSPRLASKLIGSDREVAILLSETLDKSELLF